MLSPLEAFAIAVQVVRTEQVALRDGAGLHHFACEPADAPLEAACEGAIGPTADEGAALLMDFAMVWSAEPHDF
jgi:hypothetical protein